MAVMAVVMRAATVATPLSTPLTDRDGNQEPGYYLQTVLWNTIRIAVMQRMRLSRTRAVLIRSSDPQLIKPEEQ